MPGFMGIRGLEHKNPHDMERERRENRNTMSVEAERRSREKVQEILREQDGDMSAFTGKIDDAAVRGECEKISAFPVTRIMTGRVAVLSFDDTLLTVQGIFNSVKFRHLPVVDAVGNIEGIISDRDFLRMVSPFFGTVNEQTRDKEIMARKVGMVMSRNPLCADADITILEAIKMMNRRKVSALPVVEKGTRMLLGIVTWKDIVRAFCPSGFNPSHESNRLKTGVHVNPETGESARLRAKTSESARLRGDSDSARLRARRPEGASPNDTGRFRRAPEEEPGKE